MVVVSYMFCGPRRFEHLLDGEGTSTPCVTSRSIHFEAHNHRLKRVAEARPDHNIGQRRRAGIGRDDALVTAIKPVS